MQIHDVTQAVGAHKRRKRVGRGESSGHGKTSGRGDKGCQSRSGGGTRLLHEGGQMPLFRRVPKRGFNNANFRTEYEVVNVGELSERFDAGAEVSPTTLHGLRLVRRKTSLVKILAAGELSKKLTVRAHAASAAARAAIEKAGGTIEIMAQRDAAANWKAKRRTVKKANTPASK